MSERPTVTGHAAVKQALRDTDFYSSNLQGDSDVRDYRQIPLEVDPPIHHLYRAALSPLFVRPKIESLAPQFSRIAEEILSEFEENGGGNFLDDVALRYVVTCLGVIFNRPQDVTEWLSWGASVWESGTEKRSGEKLHSYLRRVYEESTNSNYDDVWTFIRKVEINGNRINFEEFKGIGSVCLAGGRDTVVKLISGCMWHLMTHSNDYETLKSGAVSVKDVIPEFLRYFTPLPGMLRVTPEQQELADDARNPDRFTEISFASGNFDNQVFENPGQINLHRTKVSHLAFGFGPHTCIGNAIAEIETEIILGHLLEKLSAWTLRSEPVIEWISINETRFPGSFHRLEITV